MFKNHSMNYSLSNTKYCICGTVLHKQDVAVAHILIASGEIQNIQNLMYAIGLLWPVKRPIVCITLFKRKYCSVQGHYGMLPWLLTGLRRHHSSCNPTLWLVKYYSSMLSLLLPLAWSMTWFTNQFRRRLVKWFSTFILTQLKISWLPKRFKGLV